MHSNKHINHQVCGALPGMQAMIQDLLRGDELPKIWAEEHFKRIQTSNQNCRALPGMQAIIQGLMSSPYQLVNWADELFTCT